MDYVTEVRYMILVCIHALWSKRYFIVIILLCSPFLGLLIYSFTPNKYVATAYLATYTLNQNFIKDLPTAPHLEEQFDGLKAYITSPPILKSTAQQAGLISNNTSEQEIQGIIQTLSRAVSVTLSDKNMVEIKMIGNDSKKMIAIINLLSSVFIKEFLKPIITSSQSMSVILKKESAEQKNKLNQSIEQLNLFRAEHNSTNPENEDIYKDQLKNIVKSIGESEQQFREAETELLGLVEFATTTSPEIATLNKQINDNDSALNKMRLLYNDNYEGIKAAEELSFSLKKERDNLLKNHSSNTNKMHHPNPSLSPLELDSLLPEQRIKYLNLEQKINSLKAQIQDLNKQKNTLLIVLKKINKTQNEEAVFIKAVSNNQATYNDLLNRYNLAQMMSHLDFENQFQIIKIMAKPFEPLQYVGRPFIFYLLLALFSGLVLSCSLSIILDQMDNTARKRKILEKLSGIAVLSRIGKISS